MIGFLRRVVLLAIFLTGVAMLNSATRRAGVFPNPPTGPSVFDSCGYYWGNVDPLDDSYMDDIPTGSNVSGSPCP